MEDREFVKNVTAQEKRGAIQEFNILTIWGSSDDLIETDGIPGADEFNSYSSPNGYNGVIHINTKSQSGQMYIYCIYGPTGCWHFAPALVDEGIPLPNWKTSFIYEPSIANAYTTILKIEVPEDAYMQFHKRI